MPPHERPHRPRRPRGKWMALALAILVNIVFLGVLVFSVSWQNRAPVPITAELYAPPAKTPVAEPPPRTEPPPSPPRAEPPPEPAPPKIEPRPAPPPPKVAKPEPRPADIAEKARQENERRVKEQAEREKREREQKEAETKKAEEKRQAEQRDRQQREVAALRAQAERETQQRTQVEREAQLRAQAERESRERAQQTIKATDSRAQAEWVDRIRSKVRDSVIEPPDLTGNPEAVFDVIQLPTGEVIDVRLRKSSGVRAYDDAVQRAILKASPLPKAPRPEMFERVLTLRVRPRD